MDYNSAAWLQAHQIPELQAASVHDERSAAGSNDWKETAASMQGGSMNDLLGDIQVHHSPTPPLSTSNNYPLIPQLLLSTTSYAPISFSNQWIPHAPHTPSVPLSSYSSLNGATSASSHSQSLSNGQGQNQGQSQSQGSSSMVIDPALTTMNGSSSSPPPQYQQPSYLSHQAHSRMQYQYPQHSMMPMNSSFVHSGPSQYQQQQQQQQYSVQAVRPSHSPPQQQQQQQGTLSPFVLHSPPAGYYGGGISPSSFYGQPSPPVAGPSSAASPPSQSTSQSAPTPPPPPVNKVSPEQLRATLVADVKPLIQSNSFTGGGAVSQLVNILDDYGIADVDAQVRLDILTKIRDNAGNHYFRAWIDNTIAMEIVREWLKLAFVGRDDQQMVETIMPLLQIIDRLPFNVNKLKESKLGKLIIKLIKEPPTPAIKDMASNLETKWRAMLSSQVPDKAGSEDVEDPKGKKRRAESVSKSAPPVKKAAIPVAGSSTPKAVPVKKEAKAVVKDAKSDSSFFSKPKPTKKELPSFKKTPPAPAATATVPGKKPSDNNIAQPSSVDGFAEILKSWGPNAGPSTSTPPPTAGPSTGPAAGPVGGPSLGKRKKSVTWAPDGQLEQIRLIDRAVYDDDGASGSLTTHNLRDLDRDEGAALHNHLFEEQLEWTEPQPLEPPEIEIPPRGGESHERAAQEEREQTALVASYASPAQIPDSPAEPPAQMPEEQVDEGVRVMLTGPEVDAIFWSDGAPALVDTIRPSTSVADLVGQLAAATAPDVTMSDPSQPPSMPALASFNPEQLQQLVQQAQALSQNGMLAGLAGVPPPPTGPHAGADQWGAQQYTDFDRGYHEPNGVGRGAAELNRRWGEDGWADRNPPTGPRGRGGRGGPPGRGRGRGDGFRNNKRKPCSFFQAGRCRYGDQCDFSHEPLNYN